MADGRKAAEKDEVIGNNGRPRDNLPNADKQTPATGYLALGPERWLCRYTVHIRSPYAAPAIVAKVPTPWTALPLDLTTGDSRTNNSLCCRTVAGPHALLRLACCVAQ